MDSSVSEYIRDLDRNVPRWAAMYPRHLILDDDLMGDDSFWFQDALHHPRPMLPLVSITCEAVQFGLSHTSTRRLVTPGGGGISQRLLGGYVYLSVAAPHQKLSVEALEFKRRMNYCLKNWELLTKEWRSSIERLTETVGSFIFNALPRFEHTGPDFGTLNGGVGLQLILQTQRLFSSFFEAWTLHFSLLNVAYAARSAFIEAFGKSCPDLDSVVVSGLFAKTESILYHPGRLVSALADDAIALQIDDLILGADNFEHLKRLLEAIDNGRQWLALYESVRFPWFTFSEGTGLYPDDPSWDQSPDLLLGHIQLYIRDARDPYSTPPATPSRRLEDLIAPDDPCRDELLRLFADAEKTSAFLEDHNLFVEHRFGITFWRQVALLGDALKGMGFLEASSDIYLLTWYEVMQLVTESACSWATRDSRTVASKWASEVRQRAEVFRHLQKGRAPSSLGNPLLQYGEVFVATLFGRIAAPRERVLPNDPSFAISGVGVAGSLVSGTALVISHERELLDFDTLPDDVILVVKCLSASIAIRATRIRGIISETGGAVSHAAVLCREFNIPSLVGVSGAANLIFSGDRLTLNPASGSVFVSRPC